MEEILHHPNVWKYETLQQIDIYHINWFARFLNHPLYHLDCTTHIFRGHHITQPKLHAVLFSGHPSKSP